jgi:hypothetical protein
MARLYSKRLKPSEEELMAIQPVILPWSKWYRESHLRLEIPHGFVVTVLAPNFPQPLQELHLAHQLASPVGVPPLAELVQQAKRICLVLEDLTRPTKLSPVVRLLWETLSKSGIRPNNVCFVVATGCHTGQELAALREKFGLEQLREAIFLLHDPQNDVVATDLKLGNQTVRLNGHYVQADLRILVGSVIPHPVAAYSGGAKLVIPGLADEETTGYLHRSSRLFPPHPDPSANRFRQTIENLLQNCPPSFSICCLPDGEGNILSLTAGDFVGAHKQAAFRAKKLYTIEVPGPFHCLWLNAYPKDSDLVQSQAALSCLASPVDRLLEPDGLVILSAAAPMGSAGHRLFSPGGPLHAPFQSRRVLAGRELWILTPASRAEVEELFPDGCCYFASADEVLAALKDRFPRGGRLGIVPYAPMCRLFAPRGVALHA